MVSGTMAWSSGSEVVDELDDEPTVLSTPITDIGCAVDVDGLTDRVAEAEQLLGGGGAEHHHVGLGGEVVVDDEAPLGHRSDPGRSARRGRCPTTVVVQLVVPATRVSVCESAGATAPMSGATTLESSAVASPTVRVEADPKPPRIPVLDVVLPGRDGEQVGAECGDLGTAPAAGRPRPARR